MSLFSMELQEILYSSILIFGMAIAIIIEIWQQKTGIPVSPTLPHVRKAMIGLMNKYLDTDGAYEIVEPGCGWGGLQIAIAKAFPYSSVYGCELSPVPWFISKIRTLFCRDNVTVGLQDAKMLDFSKYDVVVCYLCPPFMEILKEKFSKELASGSFVICNAFPIPGWQPLEQTEVGRYPKIPVFIYRKR